MAESFRERVHREANTPRSWLIPTELKLTNHSPDGRIAMPSKMYLALHAACCKVAAMSGAGEYLDKLDRESETTLVLASDGSSSNLVTNAFWHAF